MITVQELKVQGDVSIRFDHVYKAFIARGGNDEPILALEDVSFEAGDGEFISLVGPSGCGKSTCLNLLAGLSSPSSGTVEHQGRVVKNVNTEVGYITQDDHLLPWRSQVGNVELALEFQGVPLPLLGHPGFFILLACLLGFVTYRLVGLWEPRTGKRVLGEWVRLLPQASLSVVLLACLATLLADSGMVSILAGGVAGATGSTFPVLSPVVGAIGSFLTGSTTSSNALFAGLQADVARLVDVAPTVLLAGQTAGCSTPRRGDGGDCRPGHSQLNRSAGGHSPARLCISGRMRTMGGRSDRPGRSRRSRLQRPSWRPVHPARSGPAALQTMGRTATSRHSQPPNPSIDHPLRRG